MTSISPDMHTLTQAGLGALAFARRLTEGLLDGITQEHALMRAGPDGNHAAWILGHLASADDFFLATLTGSPRSMSEELSAKYGMGSTVTDGADDYPPLTELLEQANRQRTTMTDWLATLDESSLLEPLPEDLTRFASNRAGLMSTLACHESFHGGQLSAIRRIIGLPRMM